MDNNDREEIRIMVRQALAQELEDRQFLTADQIGHIAAESTKHTLSITLQLMGVKFKDNGEVDFDIARENNDYVTRLRRGSNQAKKLMFNSCLLTAFTTGLVFLGHAVYDRIVNTLPHLPNIPTPPQ